MSDAAASKVRHPGVMTLACGLGMTVSIGPMIFGNLGLFMRPITEEFGWSRSAFSAIFLFFGVLVALSSPFWGRAIDLWGARRVLFVGLSLFGIANALLITANGSILQFYLLFAFVSLVSAPSSAVGYVKVISLAYEKNRGKAMAIALGCGAAVGGAVLAQVTRLLINDFGWRDARLAQGLFILVVIAPLVFLMLRGLPRPTPRNAAQPAGEALTGLTMPEALRTARFWLVFTMMFLGMLCLGAMQVHTVPLLEDRGVARATATNLLSIYALSTLAGQIVVGVVLDRSRTPRAGAAFFASGLIGLLVIHHSTNAALLGPGAALLGLCFGAEQVMAAYFASRFFGMRAYGQIYGMMFSGAALGSGIGPFLMATGFDRFGSYDIVLIGLELGFAVGAICILMLGSYGPGTPRRGKQEPGGAPVLEPGAAS